MGIYGTNFTESEAILAMQEGDHFEVRRLLLLMLPGERGRLRHAAQQLVEMCDQHADAPGPAI